MIKWSIHDAVIECCCQQTYNFLICLSDHFTSWPASLMTVSCFSPQYFIQSFVPLPFVLPSKISFNKPSWHDISKKLRFYLHSITASCMLHLIIYTEYDLYWWSLTHSKWCFTYNIRLQLDRVKAEYVKNRQMSISDLLSRLYEPLTIRTLYDCQ